MASFDAAAEGVFVAPPAAPQTPTAEQPPEAATSMAMHDADSAVQPQLDSAASNTTEGVVYLPVPPSEPHVTSGRPVEGLYVPSPSPASLDALDAPSHGGVVENEAGKERMQESVAAADAAAAAADQEEVFESPALRERPSPPSSELDQVDPAITAEPSSVVAVHCAVDNGLTAVAKKTDEEGEDCVPSPLVFSKEDKEGTAVHVAASTVENPVEGQPTGLSACEAVSPSLVMESSTAEAQQTPQPASRAAAAAASSEAWVVDFGSLGSKPKRKMTKKEKDAIKASRLRSQLNPASAATAAGNGSGEAAASSAGLGADSEGNAVHALDAPLQVMHLDGLANRAALIPMELTTTRADLEQRLVLRLPRLLCVNKQYPRGCGIASLTSVYNYLYSWLGESEVGAGRAPRSQEEIMSVLGFDPPFGEIAWGPFTGNVTLIRWFHALNRHFGLRGRAYILYKAHGHGKTTHLYPDNAAALVAVKAALRDPHCALIYHCHNHYMVPIGYQDIPHAQTDFLKPVVSETSTDTTLFIGEVSRGRHEALYARKWEQIVKDIECKSPFFFNIRHPEQGVQRREPKKKAAEATDAVQNVNDVAMVAGATVLGTPLPPPASCMRMPVSEHGAAEEKENAQLAALKPEATRVKLSGTTAVADGPSGLASSPERVRGEAAHVADYLTTAEGDTKGSIPAPQQGGAEASPGDADLATEGVAVHTRSEKSGEESARFEHAQHERGCAEPPVSSGTRAEDVKPLPGLASPLEPNEGTVDAPQHLAPHAFSDTTVDGGPTARSTLLPKAPRLATSKRPAPPAKPKPERGNLHCLIIFRNDQVEEHLGRYEDDTAELRAMKRPGSSSSSSNEGSSSSDEDDG